MYRFIEYADENSTMWVCSKYDQEIPQSQTADKRVASWGRARHQEDKQSKATSSLFPIEMIVKLEWAQSNTQQNIDQLQNPTMEVWMWMVHSHNL